MKAVMFQWDYVSKQSFKQMVPVGPADSQQPVWKAHVQNEMLCLVVAPESPHSEQKHELRSRIDEVLQTWSTFWKVLEK